MDFGFSEEQELLRSTARDVLTRTCPPAWVRRALEGGDEPEAVWREASKLGWMGIGVPEEDGGAGGSFIDQVVVLEEMGRTLAPGAYAATTCAALPVVASLALGAQREDLLGALVEGRRRAALVAGTDRTPADAATLPVRASRNGSHTVLAGGPVIVPGAHRADLLVVAARVDGADGLGPAVSTYVVDAARAGVEAVQLHEFDPSRGLARVFFDEVEVTDGDRLGEHGASWPAVAAAVERATVAACAELCGAGDRMLEMTVEYARVREQFDRPIGSFQAVKHLCADMLLRLETSKAAVHYAALCIDEGRDDAPLATSIAKAHAGENLPLLAEDAVQVHGGIGFTWEHDIHLYVRRAKTIEQLYGSVQWHRERVARLVGL
jgi:alkylation response protein AidB-like acyl-CoA dehydrogenase